jgi:beta-glucosidase
LLKNKDTILPISPDVRRIFVTGPNAASIEALLGNYHGFNEALSTFVEGIVGRAPEGVRVGYRMGMLIHEAPIDSLDWTVSMAGQADVTIACMGYSPLLEGEEGESILSTERSDRAEIGLPPSQEAFVKNLVMGGARVVLVLCGGGPVALGDLEEMVDAVLFAWYPGQAGGEALAELLFGDVSPSGKLPVTFPRSLQQLPGFDDYRMEGRTYRYGTLDPLYPFGFGLSYTRFEYEALKLSKYRFRGKETLSFSVKLKNTGVMDAEEVVQVYLSDLEASVPVPINKLVSFRRVSVKAGQSKRLNFTLPSGVMQLIDENGESRLEPGRFRLTVGGCSPGDRGQALGAPTPQIAYFDWMSD